MANPDDASDWTPRARPVQLRVFLASPGDVAEERRLAREVIDEINQDPLCGQVTLEPVAWDKPGTPLLATMTPQEAIARHLPKPSECDIVVVIFWSRMGPPLPPEYKKPDGSPYLSGTEWEFWDALRAHEQYSRPEVLLFRQLRQPPGQGHPPGGEPAAAVRSALPL